MNDEMYVISYWILGVINRKCDHSYWEFKIESKGGLFFDEPNICVSTVQNEDF